MSAGGPAPAEAEAGLPHNFAVIRTIVDVAVGLDTDLLAVCGTSRILIRPHRIARSKLKWFRFHAPGMEVRRVSINGIPAHFQHSRSSALTAPGQARSVEEVTAARCCLTGANLVVEVPAPLLCRIGKEETATAAAAAAAAASERVGLLEVAVDFRMRPRSGQSAAASASSLPCPVPRSAGAVTFYPYRPPPAAMPFVGAQMASLPHSRQLWFAVAAPDPYSGGEGGADGGQQCWFPCVHRSRATAGVQVNLTLLSRHLKVEQQIAVCSGQQKGAVQLVAWPAWARAAARRSAKRAAATPGGTAEAAAATAAASAEPRAVRFSFDSGELLTPALVGFAAGPFSRVAIGEHASAVGSGGVDPLGASTRKLTRAQRRAVLRKRAAEAQAEAARRRRRGEGGRGGGGTDSAAATRDGSGGGGEGGNDNGDDGDDDDDDDDEEEDRDQEVAAAAAQVAAAAAATGGDDDDSAPRLHDVEVEALVPPLWEELARRGCEPVASVGAMWVGDAMAFAEKWSACPYPYRRHTVVFVPGMAGSAASMLPVELSAARTAADDEADTVALGVAARPAGVPADPALAVRRGDCVGLAGFSAISCDLLAAGTATVEGVPALRWAQVSAMLQGWFGQLLMPNSWRDTWVLPGVVGHICFEYLSHFSRPQEEMLLVWREQEFAAAVERAMPALPALDPTSALEAGASGSVAGLVTAEVRKAAEKAAVERGDSVEAAREAAASSLDGCRPLRWPDAAAAVLLDSDLWRSMRVRRAPLAVRGLCGPGLAGRQELADALQPLLEVARRGRDECRNDYRQLAAIFDASVHVDLSAAAASCDPLADPRPAAAGRPPHPSPSSASVQSASAAAPATQELSAASSAGLPPPIKAPRQSSDASVALASPSPLAGSLPGPPQRMQRQVSAMAATPRPGELGAALAGIRGGPPGQDVPATTPMPPVATPLPPPSAAVASSEGEGSELAMSELLRDGEEDDDDDELLEDDEDEDDDDGAAPLPSHLPPRRLPGGISTVGLLSALAETLGDSLRPALSLYARTRIRRCCPGTIRSGWVYNRMTNSVWVAVELSPDPALLPPSGSLTVRITEKTGSHDHVMDLGARPADVKRLLVDDLAIPAAPSAGEDEAIPPAEALDSMASIAADLPLVWVKEFPCHHKEKRRNDTRRIGKRVHTERNLKRNLLSRLKERSRLDEISDITVKHVVVDAGLSWVGATDGPLACPPITLREQLLRAPAVWEQAAAARELGRITSSVPPPAVSGAEQRRAASNDRAPSLGLLPSMQLACARALEEAAAAPITRFHPAVQAAAVSGLQKWHNERALPHAAGAGADVAAMFGSPGAADKEEEEEEERAAAGAGEGDLEAALALSLPPAMDVDDLSSVRNSGLAACEAATAAAPGALPRAPVGLSASSTSAIGDWLCALYAALFFDPATGRPLPPVFVGRRVLGRHGEKGVSSVAADKRGAGPHSLAITLTEGPATRFISSEEASRAVAELDAQAAAVAEPSAASAGSQADPVLRASLLACRNRCLTAGPHPALTLNRLPVSAPLPALLMQQVGLLHALSGLKDGGGWSYRPAVSLLLLVAEQEWDQQQGLAPPALPSRAGDAGARSSSRRQRVGATLWRAAREVFDRADFDAALARAVTAAVADAEEARRHRRDLDLGVCLQWRRFAATRTGRSAAGDGKARRKGVEPAASRPIQLRPGFRHPWYKPFPYTVVNPTPVEVLLGPSSRKQAGYPYLWGAEQPAWLKPRKPAGQALAAADPTPLPTPSPSPPAASVPSAAAAATATALPNGFASSAEAQAASLVAAFAAGATTFPFPSITSASAPGSAAPVGPTTSLSLAVPSGVPAATPAAVTPAARTPRTPSAEPWLNERWAEFDGDGVWRSAAEAAARQALVAGWQREMERSPSAVARLFRWLRMKSAAALLELWSVYKLPEAAGGRGGSQPIDAAASPLGPEGAGVRLAVCLRALGHLEGTALAPPTGRFQRHAVDLRLPLRVRIAAVCAFAESRLTRPPPAPPRWPNIAEGKAAAIDCVLGSISTALGDEGWLGAVEPGAGDPAAALRAVLQDRATVLRFAATLGAIPPAAADYTEPQAMVVDDDTRRRAVGWGRAVVAWEREARAWYADAAALVRIAGIAAAAGGRRAGSGTADPRLVYGALTGLLQWHRSCDPVTAAISAAGDSPSTDASVGSGLSPQKEAKLHQGKLPRLTTLHRTSRHDIVDAPGWHGTDRRFRRAVGPAGIGSGSLGPLAPLRDENAAGCALVAAMLAGARRWWKASADGGAAPAAGAVGIAPSGEAGATSAGQKRPRAEQSAGAGASAAPLSVSSDLLADWSLVAHSLLDEAAGVRQEPIFSLQRRRVALDLAHSVWGSLTPTPLRLEQGLLPQAPPPLVPPVLVQLLRQERRRARLCLGERAAAAVYRKMQADKELNVAVEKVLGLVLVDDKVLSVMERNHQAFVEQQSYSKGFRITALKAPPQPLVAAAAPAAPAAGAASEGPDLLARQPSITLRIGRSSDSAVGMDDDSSGADVEDDDDDDDEYDAEVAASRRAGRGSRRRRARGRFAF